MQTFDKTNLLGRGELILQDYIPIVQEKVSDGGNWVSGHDPDAIPRFLIAGPGSMCRPRRLQRGKGEGAHSTQHGRQLFGALAVPIKFRISIETLNPRNF